MDYERLHEKINTKESSSYETISFERDNCTFKKFLYSFFFVIKLTTVYYSLFGKENFHLVPKHSHIIQMRSSKRRDN